MLNIRKQANSLTLQVPFSNLRQYYKKSYDKNPLHFKLGPCTSPPLAQMTKTKSVKFYDLIIV